MKWRVRVYCSDCGGGADPDGCFDGASELLDPVFGTKEEAEAFKEEREAKRGPPWEYDVEMDDRGIPNKSTETP